MSRDVEWELMARRELGPASLEVALAVREATASVTGGTMIIGVSGGADSMALAAAVAWEARRRARTGEADLGARAIVVDHGLQAGSGALAQTVAERVRQLGLEAEVSRVVVDQDSPSGPESAARNARYQALRAAAEGGLIMVGHTLDDQAETVLLGLARGSGLRSLAGMAPRSGDLLRPLLGVRRETTQRACAEWGIEVWEDPHNSLADYTRVRVRRHVLPVLEHELGPGIAPALARTAALARADEEALAQWARRELGLAQVPRPEGSPALACEVLLPLPVAVRTRVLKAWLEAVGVRGVTSAHVSAVSALAGHWRGQGPVALPGAVVERREGRLHATLLTL